MILLILEALLALLILIGIVWWTMFSGRKNGELKQALKEKVDGDAKGVVHDDKQPPPS
jgi:hypothetical protein